MKTQKISVPVKMMQIGLRSRIRVWLMRQFMRPLNSRMSGVAAERIGGLQARAAAGLADYCAGLSLRYQALDRVSGVVIGDLSNRTKLAILHLHGGAFMFPAAPKFQVELLGRLCRDLDAVGFMPEYRLAPRQVWPAALDDCERAYRSLLDRGFAPERIVLIGESAGGNLALCLLQRIRKHGWPMPACAIPISPITELGSVHAPPSRVFNARRDTLLTLFVVQRAIDVYVGGQDASNPEISPLYADYKGFPPLYFIMGENEMLLDDSLLAAERARAAGVHVQLDVWPVLPHAFPIMESMFVEARQAREDIVAFVRRQVETALALTFVSSDTL